ncbi:MAG: methyltransferase domain-containing protein [Elusimicrobiota bacterium]
MSPDEFALFKNSYLDDIDVNYMAPMFDELLKTERPAAVLDAGCGNGLFGRYFKEKTGCRLVGVDASPYALDEARRAGYDETHLCAKLGEEPLPFPDASFDFVLCKDVLEHLLMPLELLTELRRVLRPGGKLLCHVPNHFTLPARTRFLFTNNIDTYNFYPDSRAWDFPHIRFYTHKDFFEMCEKAGFATDQDLSLFFAVRTPKLWRTRPYQWVMAQLHARYPSSFVMGFTGLFRAK